MVKLNKKGSLMDLLYIASILLTVAVVTLIVFKVSTKLNDEFQSSDVINKSDTDDKAVNSFNTINNMFPSVVDNSFLFLTFGLAVVIFILAALVRVHPIFIVFFIILLIFFIFLCGVFSKVYQEIAASPSFQAEATQLTLTTNIMTFLPFIVGIVGGILAIVMYKNWQNA